MQDILTKQSVEYQEIEDALQIDITGDVDRAIRLLSDCTREAKCCTVNCKLKLN